MADSYTLEAKLIADLTGYTGNMKQASEQVQAFNKTVENSTKSANDSLKSVGKVLTATGAATTALGVKSLKGFGDFQQSLNQAAVIAGGTAKDIQGLADVANKMGADLPLSAQDAADAMVAMARDGASISTIKEEFPAIAEAATAAGSDLQATASIVQQSMNLWGDSLKSPQRAAAILVQTANASNASVEDMQQVLADVGGTAVSVGYSMQDTATAVGLLTNQGIPAAQAAQNLNNAITHMIKPSKSAQGVMDQLGITYYDAQGKMKPLNQVAEELSQSMAGLSDEQKNNALSVLFGQTGYKVMNGLMRAVGDTTGSTTTSWKGMSKAIQDASKDGGTANKFLSDQASEMQKNIGSKIEQVGGNWESLSNKSAAASGGVTGSLLDMTNGALQWAAESKSPFAEMTRSFVGLAPVIGPVTTAVGGFLMNAGRIGGVAKSAAKGVLGLGKGFVSMAKGTVGMAGRLLGISNNTKKVAANAKPAAKETGKFGKASATSAPEILAMGAAVLMIGGGIGIASAGMAALALAAVKLADGGAPAVAVMGAMVVSVGLMAAAFALLAPALDAGAVGLAALGLAVTGIGAGIALAGAGALAFGEGLKLVSQGIAILSANLGAIVPTLTAVGVGFASMITSFITTLAANTPAIMIAFQTLLTGLLTSLAVMIPQAVTAFVNFLISMMNAIAENGPKLITAFTNMVVSIINSLANALPKFIEAGTNFIVSLLDGVAKALPQIVPAVVNVIVTFIGEIANNLGKIIDAGVDLLKKFILGIVNAIPDIVDAAVQAVEQFVYGVGYALGRVLTSGGELIAKFVQGVLDGMSKSKTAGDKNGKAVEKAIKDIDLTDVGKHIIQGMINGVTSMAGNAWKAAVGVANSVVSHVKSALGIHSPSRVMKEVGGYFTEGFTIGIDSGQRDVKSSANTLAKYAMSPFSDGVDYRINPVTNGMKLNTDGTMSMRLDSQSQPAYVNLSMGGTTYRAFVDDISHQQGRKATLNTVASVY